MTKLLTAMVAAGIAFGLSAPIANAADASGNDWSDFKVAAKKCDRLTGAEKKQCMMDAGDKYPASTFNCDTVPQADKAQCQRYNEEWKTARANRPDGTTPAVRAGEPNPIPADAGDPTDKERNRDSTKQQESVPQPQKQ